MNVKKKDPTKTLEDARHELFVLNLVKGMTRSASYENAGFKQRGDNARVAACNLFKKEDVRARYDYLLAVASDAVIGETIASKQEMLNLAYEMMMVAAGKKGKKITVTDKNGVFYTGFKETHDLNSFRNLWVDLYERLGYAQNENESGDVNVSIVINKQTSETSDEENNLEVANFLKKQGVKTT